MAFLTADTKLNINGTVISSMQTTPDMGSEPEKVDVTTFDQKKYKRYIPGLMDPGSMTFEFIDETTNFNAAYNAEKGSGGNTAKNSYELSYPDGSKYTWEGEHRTYMISAAVGDPLKFAISCTPSSELTYTPGSASSNGTATSSN